MAKKVIPEKDPVTGRQLEWKYVVDEPELLRAFEGKGEIDIGIQYREHKTKTVDKKLNKPDRQFRIVYNLPATVDAEGNKVKAEGKKENIGWSSEGITLAYANDYMQELRENWKKGTGPRTWAEMKIERERRNAEKRDEERRERELTFEKIFDNGYADSKRGLGKRGLDAEVSLMREHIIPFFKDKPLMQITGQNIEAFITHLSAKKRLNIKVIKDEVIKTPTNIPLSASTIRYCVATIRQLWNYAKENKKIDEKFPLSRGKLPKKDNKRERFLNKDEYDLLLTELNKRSKIVHDYSLLSVLCGLRANECFSLTWEDVNFTNGQILIKDTKNDKNRKAIMPPRVREMLERRYNDTNKHEKYVAHPVRAYFASCIPIILSLKNSMSL